MTTKMKRVLSFFLAFLICFSFLIIPAYAKENKTPVITSTLTADDLPEYEGYDYFVVNDNVPDFYVWQITTEAYIKFSPLDDLGRTGAGMACLGPETLAESGREQTGNVKPSGWHTVRYDDLIEDKYLYNRAHVIAFMLSGDSKTPENLFTGTRHLNVGSMLQYEIIIDDYIKATGNHVIYRSTPIYRDNDLVATGVQLEAWSVEDSGKGVCFNVVAYNIQPGVIIDYTTGDSELDPDYLKANDNDTIILPEMGVAVSGIGDRAIQNDADQTPEEPAITYVLNTNSLKFHYPTCSSVSTIKDKNRRDFYGTRDELIAMGYDPCGRCHP